MSKEHRHISKNANKKTLLISFIIIAAYMIIEIIGGFLTNSLVLLSDAGHMLSDSFSLGIALFAFILSETYVNKKKTFGNKRLEILAALINGLALLGISVFIFSEAIKRFINPETVATSGMLIISIFGLLVNILVAFIMGKGGDTKGNLNMRGAFLHVLSDTFGSVGAIIAAIFMMAFGWKWADPLASILVALLALRSGFIITKDALHILMEATPKNVDVEAVIAAIRSEEKIKALYDLHIWTITSGFNALTCQISVDEKISLKASMEIISRIEEKLKHLHISHTTIQISTKCPPEAIFCVDFN